MRKSIFSKPEFYDLFGFPTFVFLTAVSLWAIITKNNFPDWIVYVLLIIGLAGMVVDGTIVYEKFVKKLRNLFTKATER
jgi:hypothetical protein